ncbi:MAG: DUF4157 domain-containing protein, partial [Spirulina sp. SIO3F2]|nr:DUF4157 domain-containing protein [Spirulina sp. SIO3F2]
MAYAAPQPQPTDKQPQQQRKKKTQPAPTVAQTSQDTAPIAEAPLSQTGSMLANVMRAEQGNPSPSAPQISLQPKLTIGQPNDRYEQEADRTARQVVQQINSPQLNLQRQIQLSNGLTPTPLPIQAADAATGGTASAGFEQQLNQARSGGQPLKPQIAQQMGSAMNADFSGIKIHTDSTSDQLNRSVQARAFTTGPDIFFKRGEYNPSTKGGQELIAHELTHTVQQ